MRFKLHCRFQTSSQKKDLSQHLVHTVFNLASGWFLIVPLRQCLGVRTYFRTRAVVLLCSVSGFMQRLFLSLCDFYQLVTLALLQQELMHSQCIGRSTWEKNLCKQTRAVRSHRKQCRGPCPVSCYLYQVPWPNKRDKVLVCNTTTCASFLKNFIFNLSTLNQRNSLCQ